MEACGRFFWHPTLILTWSRSRLISMQNSCYHSENSQGFLGNSQASKRAKDEIYVYYTTARLAGGGQAGDTVRGQLLTCSFQKLLSSIHAQYRAAIVISSKYIQYLQLLFIEYCVDSRGCL